MLIQEENNRILGAHVFGPHVDDVINLFALAIRLGARASEVGNVLYAYPSVVTSENVGRFDSSLWPWFSDTRSKSASRPHPRS